MISLIIIGGVLLRLVAHMPNFAPITALALFGGVYINKKYAVIVPFIAMAISDYLLLYINPFSSSPFNFSHIYPVTMMFHTTTLYVYGSFVASSLIGIYLKNHKNPGFILTGSFIASLQFFVITNFGVWAGGMYSRELDGLFQSYLMGLPFFKWTLLGDLFYATMFFGIYELAKASGNWSVGQKVAE